MTDEQIKNTIRKKLKEMGYNNKQVSVTGRYAGYSSSIRVTIKDKNIPIKPIKAMANNYESVDRDEYTGEILMGGNTYIFVEYDYDVDFGEGYTEIAEELWNLVKNDEKGDYTIGKYPNGRSMMVGRYRNQDGRYYISTNRNEIDNIFSDKQFIGQVSYVIGYGIVNDGLELKDEYKKMNESKRRFYKMINEKTTEEIINDATEELIETGAFTNDEIILVAKGWGDTMQTLDRICQVRFGMDCLQYLGWDENGEELDESTLKESKGYKKMTRAEIIKKALKNNATEINSYEGYLALSKNRTLHSIAFAMDINGNLSAKLFVDDDGEYYYCTNKGELVKFPY